MNGYPGFPGRPGGAQRGFDPGPGDGTQSPWGLLPPALSHCLTPEQQAMVMASLGGGGSAGGMLQGLAPQHGLPQPGLQHSQQPHGLPQQHTLQPQQQQQQQQQQQRRQQAPAHAGWNFQHAVQSFAPPADFLPAGLGSPDSGGAGAAGGTGGGFPFGGSNSGLQSSAMQPPAHQHPGFLLQPHQGDYGGLAQAHALQQWQQQQQQLQQLQHRASLPVGLAPMSAGGCGDTPPIGSPVRHSANRCQATGVRCTLKPKHLRNSCLTEPGTRLPALCTGVTDRGTVQTETKVGVSRGWVQAAAHQGTPEVGAEQWPRAAQGGGRHTQSSAEQWAGQLVWAKLENYPWWPAQVGAPEGTIE